MEDSRLQYPWFPEGPIERDEPAACSFCRTGEQRDDLVVYKVRATNQPLGRLWTMCDQHRVGFEAKYGHEQHAPG